MRTIAPWQFFLQAIGIKNKSNPNLSSKIFTLFYEILPFLHICISSHFLFIALKFSFRKKIGDKMLVFVVVVVMLTTAVMIENSWLKNLLYKKILQISSEMVTTTMII